MVLALAVTLLIFSVIVMSLRLFEILALLVLSSQFTSNPIESKTPLKGTKVLPSTISGVWSSKITSSPFILTVILSAKTETENKTVPASIAVTAKNFFKLISVTS